MNTMKLKTLIAATAVGVVALGPATGLAFAEKPRAGPPDRAETSRFARRDDRGQPDARPQDRGRGNEMRRQDRGPPAARPPDRGRDPGPENLARNDNRSSGAVPTNLARNDNRNSGAAPASFARNDNRSRDAGPDNRPRSDNRSRDAGPDNRSRNDNRSRDAGPSHFTRGDRRDDDHRYDSRSHDSRHYVRPVYRPAQYRPPLHKHYTYYDTRWNHRHYYPPRGYYYPYAPRNAVIVHHHHHRYYYGSGIWYAPRGGGWAVVAPPLGIFVSLLPPYYSTVWFGGIPYYYANDVYYLYRARERVYEVVAPPYGAQATSVSLAAEDIYVYPQHGQSQEQADFDRYECHRWAIDETGFDPTRPDGGVGAGRALAARGDYLRAMTACLEGRGYSVR